MILEGVFKGNGFTLSMMNAKRNPSSSSFSMNFNSGADHAQCYIVPLDSNPIPTGFRI